MTAEARMRALAIANEVRGKRSALKADLRSGRVRLADVLLSEEPWLQSMQVRELLLSTPAVGKVKANRALRYCWISSTATLGQTSRQSREKLLQWLADRHPKAGVGEWRRSTHA